MLINPGLDNIPQTQIWVQVMCLELVSSCRITSVLLDPAENGRLVISDPCIALNIIPAVISNSSAAIMLSA